MSNMYKEGEHFPAWNQRMPRRLATVGRKKRRKFTEPPRFFLFSASILLEK